MNVQQPVNLLDNSQEPTDEQLESLMRDVAREVRAKAAKANKALMDTLVDEAAKVRAGYKDVHFNRGGIQ